MTRKALISRPTCEAAKTSSGPYRQRFELALQQNLGHASAIENIDIGGPCMVRASAKSHQGCAILSDPSQYAAFIQEVRQTGSTSPLLRRKLAAEAFAKTADYDAKIARSAFSKRIGTRLQSEDALRPVASARLGRSFLQFREIRRDAVQNR